MLSKTLVRARDPLSPREREVLAMLAQGQRGTELAKNLGLSGETVRTHVRNAMGKLDARTRAQAVAIAVERGVVSPTEAHRPPASMANRSRSRGGVSPPPA